MDPSPLHLTAELLTAITGTHSPRALVRTFAEVLGHHAQLARVELGDPERVAIAEWSAGAWRNVETPSNAAQARPIVPGLAVVPQAPLPALFSDPEVCAVLARVVQVALHHLEVIQRVARVSQRAHAEARELRADLERLEDTGPIIANSAAMRAVVSRATLVARHATTVLLTGESGTGKEIIAREIHRRSPRGHRPMLQLNCAAIPEALIESELFGHERGAFTGAERTHAGVFERAHRSTLLLDEVGELSLAAQAKLLRVLQERQICRVGGEVQHEVDVRLIAATHRPLAAMVRAGTFREDLFYRLDVFSIAVPPLRDRRDDLGPLTVALARELAARLGTAVPPIPRALIQRLRAHDWPGNVRELANLLETALVLGGGTTLVLPDEFPDPSRRLAEPGPRAQGFGAAVRDVIEAALRATRGQIYGAGGAAARLGLKPATLQSKMKKLGVDRARFVD